MRHLILFSLSIVLSGDFQTPFERSKGMESATYQEAIDFYTALDDEFKQVKMLEYGVTDVGKPLHAVVISNDKKLFKPENARNSDKVILMINNGIHAGEPCGIDASMMLARDLVTKAEMQKWLEHVVIVIIPAYSIGGVLNRGKDSRVNQIGPKEHGFRGNARNLDLNRDFLKADSKNAQSFAEIFQDWLPHILIDTHTTNGADYQAELTYILTQEDMAGKLIGEYGKQFLPKVLKQVEDDGFTTCPYVHAMGRTPEEKGIMAFPDYPRYSSGYSALFHTMGFITEAHMLKPFKERVEATYSFLSAIIQEMNADYQALDEMVENGRKYVNAEKTAYLQWELDTSRVAEVMYHGYEATFKKSSVTGGEIPVYDQAKPFSRKIPFYKHYKPTITEKIPDGYIIPQAYHEVIKRLELNKVEMKRFQQDQEMEVEISYLEEVGTITDCYEGHYYHDKVVERREKQVVKVYAGDVMVSTQQMRRLYIAHVLEPKGNDSFFRWNFFDEVLMRKEYFSPYLFDSIAEEMMKDEKIRKEFEQKKAEDENFAKTPWLQWDFLYRKSPHYEPTHLRYPVFRVYGNEPK